MKIPAWFVLLAIACLVAPAFLAPMLGLPDFVVYGAIVGVICAAMPFALKQKKPPVG